MSQQTLPGRAAILHRYQQAEEAYQKAVRVGGTNSVSEEAEDRLNQLALDRFSSVYSLLAQTSPPYDSLLFFTGYKLGELHHYFSHEKEALRFYQLAVRTWQHAGLPDSLLFKPYLYQGILLYNQSQFDQALSFFKTAEKVQALYAFPLAENQRLYNALGAHYFTTGNYSSAKIYFQKALDVLQKDNPSYRALYVNYAINIATASAMLQSYAEARSMYQKVLPFGINRNEIYHSLGQMDLKLGDLPGALAFFHQVQAEGRRATRLYDDLGYAHFQLRQFDSARFYYAKANAANRVYSDGAPSVDHGITLLYQGRLAMANRRPDSALVFYQNALHQFYPAFRDTSGSSNPQTFSGVFSYINLFDLLTEKAAAQAAMHRKTGKQVWLVKELETYEAAFQLIDYVERTYNSDEARLFLGKIKYQVHDRPIAIACKLYQATGDARYLQRAYRLDQQNKASLLAFTVRLGEHLQASPLLKEEQRLKTAITRLSLRAQQASGTQALDTLQTAIRNQEIALGQLQEKLNDENPATGVRIPAIADLQAQFLDDQTALLSFHLSDSVLTVFTITRNSASCLQKSFYPGFKADLQAMVNSLRQPREKQVSEAVSRRLSAFLVGTVSQKRLLIVPDDELNALPFEALVDQNGRYLVERHTVQYQYSTALLRKEGRDFSAAATLAFAPFADKGFSGSNLQFARLQQSTKEFGAERTTAFTGDRATKQLFLAQRRHPAILHFATHAAVNKTDNQYSFIAFSPDGAASPDDYLLYAREIASLPLRGTRLVILSACETGSGDLVKGEGVMSLSRAFAYAGCPNTVASFWQADDASTAYLVKRMHDLLASGAPVDKALQQAKKDYLADPHIHPRLKSPAYWAHLVFVGNYQPEASHHWYGWAGGALFLLLAFWVYRRLTKR